MKPNRRQTQIKEDKLNVDGSDEKSRRRRAAREETTQQQQQKMCAKCMNDIVGWMQHIRRHRRRHCHHAHKRPAGAFSRYVQFE